MLNDFVYNLKNKVSTEYYNVYYELLISYDAAMDFLKVKNFDTYQNFYNWYVKEGIIFFEETVNDLIEDKLDNRFIVFMELYKSYLIDAIEDDCIQVLLDFLYMIPRRMKEDFSKFGFLVNEVQEHTWEYSFYLDMETLISVCDYEPDYFCQASLF